MLQRSQADPSNLTSMPRDPPVGGNTDLPPSETVPRSPADKKAPHLPSGTTTTHAPRKGGSRRKPRQQCAEKRRKTEINRDVHGENDVMSESPPKKAENPPPSIIIEFDAAEDRDTLAKRLQQLAMHMQRSFDKAHDGKITVTQENPKQKLCFFCPPHPESEFKHSANR
jgi:hypothetical protein